MTWRSAAVCQFAPLAQWSAMFIITRASNMQRRGTYVFLKGSCPCVSSGSEREVPCPGPRELGLGAAAHRSSQPFACGRHWARSQWPWALLARDRRYGGCNECGAGGRCLWETKQVHWHLARLRVRAWNRSDPSGTGLCEVLHWEKQSAQDGQHDAHAKARSGGQTLGGIRVERPRFWMKLILTAGGQLAPTALSMGDAVGEATHLGWQDDGEGGARDGGRR